MQQVGRKDLPGEEMKQSQPQEMERWKDSSRDDSDKHTDERACVQAVIHLSTESMSEPSTWSRRCADPRGECT